MVDIEKIERRTVQYFYNDGLLEIAFGVITMLTGGYLYGQAILPKDSSLHIVIYGLSFVLVPLSIFLVMRTVRFFKGRITYPRGGFVEYKKKESTPACRRRSFIIGAFSGILTVLFLDFTPILLPAGIGLLLAIALFFFAKKTGLIRFYFLASVCAVIGLILSIAGIGDLKGLCLYCGFFGATLTLSGLTTLIVFFWKSAKSKENGFGN